MVKSSLCFCLLFLFTSAVVKAQEVLPAISVKNAGGRVVISWRNEYVQRLSTINIQRSYDSLKNYTTIGSVLNPESRENGYADATYPYDRMFYRVFIGFENGSYLYSEPLRPAIDNSKKAYGGIRYAWQYDPPPAPPPVISAPKDSAAKRNIPTKVPEPAKTIRPSAPTNIIITPPVVEEKKPTINYVSLNRDHNVTLLLPEAKNKNYLLRFSDESGREIFKIKKPQEEFLILEKVNFIHSGWFNYEIYEEGKLLTKDRIFIPRDQKSNADSKKQAN